MLYNIIQVKAGKTTINGAYIEDGSIQPLCFYSITFILMPQNSEITLNTNGYATYCNENTVTIDGTVAYTCQINEDKNKAVINKEEFDAALRLCSGSNSSLFFIWEVRCISDCH